MGDLKLIELFSGIGAFSKALEELGIPHERTAVCEIDKYAVQAYEAIHGPTPNLGDITEVKELPECDILTYSFPCQDLSRAGIGAGMSRESGTRSGLIWEVERLLSVERERPRHLIMENVDSILDSAHIRDFRRWIRSLSGMGYTSSYQVMDGTDYGVPQQRKRCIMVSNLGYDKLRFPEPCPDGRVLRDIMEEEVDERYFLSEEVMSNLIAHKERHDARGNGFGFKITDPATAVASTLTAVAGRNTSNYVMDRRPSCILSATIDPETEPYDMSAKVYSSDSASPTITTRCGERIGPKIQTDKGVRRLTPKEYWRLQGFPDSDFRKAQSTGLSDAQLYRLAGNSIPVPVLKAVFKAMLLDRTWIRTPTLSAFTEESYEKSY